MQKKILIVGMSANPGGVETYLMNFLEIFKKKAQLVFLTNEDKIAYYNKIVNEGADVFLAKGNYSLNSYLGRKIIAKKILRQVHPDILYVNALTQNNAYWVLAANSLKIRVIYHSHNDHAIYTSFIKKLVSYLLLPYHLRVLSRAGQLAASTSSANFMFGKKNHAEIVYNAIQPTKWLVDGDVRTRTRKLLGYSDSDIVLIMVARMQPQKNHLRAIQIFTELFHSDHRYRLLLVGDGELRDEITKVVSTNKIESVVSLLGMRTDIPDLMSAADVLFLPSLFEGLPFVAVEAQGSGLQIVASEGAVPEVAEITNGIHRVSLKDQNSVWVSTIRRIQISSVAQRICMNQLVDQSKFSINTYARQIQKIF